MTHDLTHQSPWSAPSGADHNAQRAEAEQVQHATERRLAVRVIAGSARDRADAQLLFDILGLGTDDFMAAHGGTGIVGRNRQAKRRAKSSSAA